MSNAWAHGLLNFIWPAIPTLIALSLCVLVEYISPRDRYALRDRLPGAIYVLAAPILATALFPILGAMWASLGVKPLINLTTWPEPIVLALLIVFSDFLYYWEHRFEHRFVWAVHSVHHAHVDLHAANDYPHPLELIMRYFFLSIPLSLIGFTSIGLPIIALLCVAFWAFFAHAPTNLHVGPLRRVIVDERFHRIHHSLALEHRDRNFAAIFTIWDQLFGTAYFPKAGEHPKVGLDGLPLRANRGPTCSCPFES